ncbi:uncharacterized protein LOC118745259 [Rhagoletis pomonella]|uniref:uncharacterized protein LOC118745259 n=1 Tax=Rhagoletis pomonella TaxID=28610 RepID=UPI001780C392|nr:uncharacterized protein LOC118745259 [Rhagoletis pomonella]
MKTIFICLLSTLLAAAQAELPAIDPALKEVLDVCSKDINISVKELNQYAPKSFDPTTLPQSIKCFLKCIPEKFGFYDNDTLDEALATKHLEDRIRKTKQPDMESIRRAVQQCSQIRDDGGVCDKGGRISVCIGKIEIDAVNSA